MPATKMVYGSLPTSEEQKQHLHRIKEAQEYLSSHRVKELYSKLVYELVVNRPNQAIPFMIERLKEIKDIGLDKPRQPRPRLISVVTDCKDDFEINQAIKHVATDFNMKIINPKNFANNQELKTDLEEYMEVSNYRDFIMLHSPSNIADLINMEQDVVEFDMCIYFQDISLPPSSAITDLQIVLQYFEAVGKFNVIQVTKELAEEKIFDSLKNLIHPKI
ncbi:hypothetical protein C9374_001963 [Naegleria lovaniensis]|uniref:Uncharacterized protein n=1 Tax=Naegleria lovaniensis TaxID=51637 RepID=A0AA88GV79_NAELO|nr:uncharacterized protein C9374_001963 [Naegleria lovaniensis]KAG2386928.1 hypothetical protein C9374_001963 [Naegleria lovaniensis]